MAGVNFTLQAAQRIVAAVKKMEQTPIDLRGDATPNREQETSFWAMITGAADINGLFHDWVKCEPAATMATAMGSTTLAPSNVWKFSDPYVAGFGNAREANDNREIPLGSVVRLTFLGYAFPLNNISNPGTITKAGGSPADITPGDGTVPMYVFQYATTPQQVIVPIHDHRDNVTGGGFSFACFHPGTALPQQPFSI